MTEGRRAMRRSVSCVGALVPRSGYPSVGASVRAPMPTVRLVSLMGSGWGLAVAMGLNSVMLRPTAGWLGGMRGKRVAALSHLA
ncbi:hypothetical protein AR457_35450 [Streptomyces agglomeratus]|nr:hypothetical protein AR457_36865 [Streptomyces agglomeratus]OEJ36159.1 hypothetical protein AR457_35450 [Streptomyces agglomeratus]